MNGMMALRDPALCRACRRIADLTDGFCLEALDDEHADLCRRIIAVGAERGVGLSRGLARSWASAVVHAVAWVNLLDDPARSPYLPFRDIAHGFGVTESNMWSKSRLLRSALDLRPLDPEWCAPSSLHDNPMIWFVEVNGVLVDMRRAPRSLQGEAYRRGAIPHLPRAAPDAEPLPVRRRDWAGPAVIARIGVTGIAE